MYFCEKFSKRGVTSHQKIRSSRWEWCMSASVMTPKISSSWKMLSNLFVVAMKCQINNGTIGRHYVHLKKRISMTWRTFTGKLSSMQTLFHCPETSDLIGFLPDCSPCFKSTWINKGNFLSKLLEDHGSPELGISCLAFSKNLRTQNGSWLHVMNLCQHHCIWLP